MRSLSGKSLVGILLLFVAVISHRVLYIMIVGTLFLRKLVLLLIVIIHHRRIIQFPLLMLISAVCRGAHTVDISEEVVLLVLVQLSLSATQPLLGLYHAFYNNHEY